MTDSSEIDPATLPEIKNVDDEPDLSSTESKEEAETKGLALKDEGNTALKEGHYTEAIHHYSTALSHLPDNAIILSNRALAYIKVENYGLAIQECVLVDLFLFASFCISLIAIYYIPLLYIIIIVPHMQLNLMLHIPRVTIDVARLSLVSRSISIVYRFCAHDSTQISHTHTPHHTTTQYSTRTSKGSTKRLPCSM